MPVDSVFDKHNGRRLLTSLLATLLTFFCLTAIAPVYAFHFPWDQGHDTTDPEDPQDPGPCEGPECENDPCNQGSSGSPVYLATGHFIWSETDIDLRGRPRLSVTRTFNSHDPRVGLLGSGWSMSCDQGLVYTVRHENNNNVITQVREYVRRLPNGKRYIYAAQANGTYVAPGLFDIVTRQADNTARLQRRDGSYSIYSELSHLQSDVDRNGNIVNFTYDAQGRLTQKADINGRALTYEYNSNGLVSIIRDHTGREWQYGYDDTNANLISVTDPLSGVRQYEYAQYQPVGDGNTYSHLTGIIDETGVVETEVTYNDIRVTSYKAYENTFNYQYDTVNRRVTKTDSQGSQWVFTYNATGQFTQIEAPLNRTTLYDRDQDSLLTRLVDPAGTEYTYTYDQYSNLLTQTDTRGAITTTHDNEKPWPLTLTSRSGRVTTITYDPSGNPLTVTDPSGAITTLAWSAQGDLERINNALNNPTNVTYNIQGLPLNITDPLGRATQYQYDVLNNLTQMTNPANETDQYQYDALDRITAYTDGNGDITQYTYDAADRITQMMAANSQTVQYAYDTFGRLSQRIFYDGTTETYQYRGDNLMTQRVRPDNVTIGYTYDAAKRLTRRMIGSEDTYQYAYNLRDELTSISNNTGTISIVYDDFGRKVSEIINNETLTYQYNTEDEITQLNGLEITQIQQFDVRGLLSQININGSTVQYAYDALTRLTAMNRSGVTNTGLQYDIANQLTQINHGSGQRSHQYQYDLASRISQWQGVANETRDYAYDDTSRLTTVQSAINPEIFSYDALGNRQNNNAQFDVANRITEDDSFIYTYDINGNRTQKTNKSTGEIERYSYNSLDQLVRYQAYPDSDPATTPTTDYNYAYGPMARRWSKQDNLGSNETQFYWSGSQLIGEATNGTLRRYIMEGLTPIAFVENNGTYHYFRDHLGTAHEVIDSSGNLVWQGSYDSFGEVTETVSAIKNNLRFAGQYHDRESGLYYNYFRDYDPTTGKYTTSDSIGLAGGLNTYGYAYQNPLSYVDPDGLFAIVLVIPSAAEAVVAALVGTGIGAGICATTGLCNESAEDDESKPQSCPTPNTDSDDFENVKKSKAKKNKKTGEIWEPDLFHKDHWEVYKDKKNWEKGKRSKSVWSDGRVKQYF